MNRPAPVIAGTLAVLLLLFGAYMGAYYALVNRKAPWEIVPPDEPNYRAKGRLAESLLLPAHQFDRLIRPGNWGDN